jgi:uncharacterized Zn finger protein
MNETVNGDWIHLKCHDLSLLINSIALPVVKSTQMTTQMHINLIWTLSITVDPSITVSCFKCFYHTYPYMSYISMHNLSTRKKNLAWEWY